MLAALLVAIAVCGELYRLLSSDEKITPRTLLARCLLALLASLSVLSAKAYKPDIDDMAIVGLASVVAIMGYSFFEEPLKAGLRRLFKSFIGRGKRDDSE